MALKFTFTLRERENDEFHDWFIKCYAESICRELQYFFPGIL